MEFLAGGPIFHLQNIEINGVGEVHVACTMFVIAISICGHGRARVGVDCSVRKE